MSRVVYNGERPKLSSSWPVAFITLLEACWQNDPLDRPSMGVVFESLKEIYQQLDLVA
jgi:hypothetical protein